MDGSIQWFFFHQTAHTHSCGFAKHLSGTRNDSCSNICKLGTSKGQDPHGPKAYPLFGFVWK